MEEMGGGEGGLPLTYLPEDCVVAVVGLTCPKDACAVARVSKFFKKVADSNTVWEKFLPSDYHSIVPGWERWQSKKEQYRRLCDVLCDNPISIDGDRTSLSWDKGSGKWCCMLSARSLMIIWGDTHRSWEWNSLPDARFAKVAKLLDVCWSEIRGTISTARLSPDTPYVAYLVFKRTQSIYGFENRPIETQIGVVGSQPARRIVRLMAGGEHGSSEPKRRRDGWLEAELGEFFNRRDLQKELQVSILKVKSVDWKLSLIIQGIALRPRCK